MSRRITLFDAGWMHLEVGLKCACWLYAEILCRLHTAILDRPPSSAATMEVQGPDTK